MNRVKLVLAILGGMCVGIPIIMFGARKKRMWIKIPHFKYGERINAQYTCDGTGESPPLILENVPSDAQSLIVLLENLESETGSGEWVHWLVFNLPRVENLPVDADIQELGGVVGKNSIGKNSYAAPCPSKSNTYHFRLYALDTVLALDETADKETVMQAAQNHIIEQADLIGQYQRPAHPEKSGL